MESVRDKLNRKLALATSKDGTRFCESCDNVPGCRWSKDGIHWLCDDCYDDLQV